MAVGSHHMLTQLKKLSMKKKRMRFADSDAIFDRTSFLLWLRRSVKPLWSGPHFRAQKRNARYLAGLCNWKFTRFSLSFSSSLMFPVLFLVIFMSCSVDSVVSRPKLRVFSSIFLEYRPNGLKLSAVADGNNDLTKKTLLLHSNILVFVIIVMNIHWDSSFE